MKKIVLAIVAVGAIVLVAGHLAGNLNDEIKRKSDVFAREQVVKLVTDQGSCTGVEITAPSGRVYTLTARHCKILIQDDHVAAITEDGQKHFLKVISIDKNSDLMLLQGVDGYEGVHVAKQNHKYEGIHSMTHGHGKPTYRTDGLLLDEEVVQVLMGFIHDADDQAKCLSTPSASAMESPFGTVCVMDLILTTTTAKIVPGSSGGPILDAAGSLVGIASATDSEGMFSYLVRLSDIKDFLKGR